MDTQQQTFDVVILGAGPAGLAAALWCGDLGLSSVVVDHADVAGGQLNRIYSPIVNYPGILKIEPTELSKTLLSQAKKHADVITGVAISAIEVEKRTVTLADGRAYSGSALVIATGVRRRQLGVPGEAEFANRGILESGAKQAADVVGKRVAIVGGGDAAFENALILGKLAAKVSIIHRRDHFSARDEFVDAVSRLPNVEMITNTSVRSIGGDDMLRFIELDGPGAKLGIDALLIRIGVEPNSQFLAGRLQLDPNGSVIVDVFGATSEPDVYAIGDVTSNGSPTIATAIGQAASVAKRIAGYLVDRQ